MQRLRSARGLTPYLLVVVVVVVAVVAQNALLLAVATLTAIYGIWGTSFNIVWGYGGQFSMAQVALGATGAYTTAILDTQFNWNFWLALLAAIGVGVCVSIVIGLIAMRLTGFYFAIMTLAFASLVLQLLSIWNRVGGTTGMASASNPGVVTIGSLHWDLTAKNGGLLILATLFLLFFLGVITQIERTRTGRALSGVREDQALAASVGVSSLHYRLLAFAASALVAVVAGTLYGLYLLFISPSFFDISVVITLIAITVIGGTGHKFGPVLGAAIYMILTQYLTWAGTHSDAIFGAVLVIMMLVAPAGILGHWKSVSRWAAATVRNRKPPESVVPDATPVGAKEVKQ
jgi:branched-chain amino acid transport system permease protein